MSIPQRPDLTGTSPAIQAYIEALEAEIDRLQTSHSTPARQPRPPAEPAIPSEPPTTINLVTLTAGGLAKRTARHFYSRQRRGGMGIFDLDSSEKDPPALLALADESRHLLLITSRARVFRLPVASIPQTGPHSRGQSIVGDLPLMADESLALAMPDSGDMYLAFASQQGHVRTMGSHLFGERMKPGLMLFDAQKYGPPIAACWTPSSTDLLLATRQGLAIRFSLKQVSMQGSLGIRLAPGDVVAGISPVNAESGVFMMTADGKGTIRLMSKFRPHKTPGGSGKVAMKTEEMVGTVTVTENDDIFALSQLGKIIRFQASDIPAKEGVVQGVNCMALRADTVVALVASPSNAG